jgi:hypothetical protein
VTDLYTPTGPSLADDLAHLGQLHAVDQHDESTVSQRTLAAVAALLAEREQMAGTLEVVRKMRRAQIAYFKTRGGLSDCKALESRADAMLKQ